MINIIKGERGPPTIFEARHEDLGLGVHQTVRFRTACEALWPVANPLGMRGSAPTLGLREFWDLGAGFLG